MGRGLLFGMVAGGAALLAGCSSADSSDAAVDASTPVLDSSIADVGPGLTLDALPFVPDAPIAEAGDAMVDSPDAPNGPACTPPLATDPCGLDPQCGCSTNQTCDIADENGGTACVAAGTALMGHACLTTASCAAGLTCSDGACRAYCSTRGDAGCLDAGGGPCVGVSNGDPDGGTVPFDDVCTFACALNDRSACGATGSLLAGCVVASSGGTDCATAGNAAVNGDCSSALCLPGLTCVVFQGGPTQCKTWCRVGEVPDDCANDDAGSCQSFTTAITANGTQYGFCP